VFLIIPNLFIIKLSTNQSLEGEDGVGSIDNSLSFSRQANKTLSMFREGHYRRRRPCTFSVLDDTGSLALHDRHT
jgi:hypothetical protein